MRRPSSLVILMIPLLGLAASGCRSFTLVGNVNLGATIPSVVTTLNRNGDVSGQGSDNEQNPPCLPKRLPTVAKEFKAHGYITGHEPSWKATRAWFEAIGKLPTCPEVKK